jgi:hypothetical protein
MPDEPEPCRCPAPNPECRRAGVPMTEPYWQLCAGVSCPPAHSAGFRRAWDRQSGALPPAAPVPGPAAGPCPHRGPFTGDYADCQTCKGRVRLKVYECAAHGRCTVPECERRRAAARPAPPDST